MTSEISKLASDINDLSKLESDINDLKVEYREATEYKYKDILMKYTFLFSGNMVLSKFCYDAFKKVEMGAPYDFSYDGLSLIIRDLLPTVLCYFFSAVFESSERNSAHISNEIKIKNLEYKILKLEDKK